MRLPDEFQIFVGRHFPNVLFGERLDDAELGRSFGRQIGAVVKNQEILYASSIDILA
jgi:hypothetical protein